MKKIAIVLTLIGSLVSTYPAEEAALPEWGEGKKVLIIGGGSAHDYNRWYNEFDSALINETGKYTAKYFQPPQLTSAIVESADLILTSANMAFPEEEVRKALFAHVENGKGMVLLHAGLWYSWSDWPEYNKTLAGGGARGHDRFGEFEVTVRDAEHPVLKDVPSEFMISDELYYYQPDDEGTPIEVLATAHSERREQTFPQVFIIRHPEAKMVGITLGHDGQAHELPAFQKILINALDWVSAAE